MNILEVKDLCFAYEQGKTALSHVDMDIPKGKITALLGGNGAGKSTLFLNLNGVLTPDSGQIFFDGQPVKYDKKGIRELRRRIGIVFQDPNDQLFSASVRKDVSFGAVNLGLPAQEVQRRVAQAVEQTGIADYLDRPTHALSFGQKKRVAIAGVLVMQPDVIILDEPTAGLDPSGVSEILHLLLQIKQESGISVILATHEIDIVPLYCDYAYVLAQGQITMQGTPADLFAQPTALRANHLRLPRIAHLMEVLHKEDGMAVDARIATISAARRALKDVT